MVPITKITGRLGNQMFQFATLYAKARDEDTDFYFQDPKYFDKYRDEIRKLYGEGIEPIDMVAIHVRRADNPVNPNEPKYCENPFYVNLFQTTYYTDAMAMFPEEEFLVFSDDIEWCKRQDIFKGCEFSEGTEIEDLNRMAGCKGIIMANSSFSWWGAYLSNAKIVAPLAWHPDGVERTKLLPEWKRI